MFVKSTQMDTSEAFREDEAPNQVLDWFVRLKSLDALFRKVIWWTFFFCVLGVVVTNTIQP